MISHIFVCFSTEHVLRDMNSDDEKSACFTCSLFYIKNNIYNYVILLLHFSAVQQNQSDQASDLDFEFGNEAELDNVTAVQTM